MNTKIGTWTLVWLMVVLLVAPPWVIGQQPTAPPQASAAPAVKPEQLDQLTAPIALYPDALAAQILIAATYPLEIVEGDRRHIGENELNVIQVCLAIVDAQRDYAMNDRDGSGVLQYAQKFVSDPGKKNGLYWEAKAGDESSPLGPIAAPARREGYKASGGKSVPYHGYYYRILRAQGKDAPGGSRSYVAKGKMIGDFGMVGYPAQYGNSGVMTFIVNYYGKVFQKNLGKDTASIANAMTAYNPDSTWTEVKQ